MAAETGRSGCWWIAGIGLALGGLVVLVGGGWALGVAVERNSESYRRSVGAVLADPYVAALVGGEVQVDEWLPDGEIVETTGGGTATFTVVAKGPKDTLPVIVTSFKKGEAWEVARMEVVDFDGPVSVAEFAAEKGVAVGARSGEVTPASVGSGSARASQSVTDGRQLYDAGRDAEAMTAFDLAIELDPSHAEAHHWRGRTKVRLGDELGAGSDLARAVELAPDNATAWEGLAWVRVRAGQDYEAIDALTRFLALRPGDGKALNDRANARFRTGDSPGAIQDAKAACDGGYSAGCTTWERLERGGR
jgi:hypothetical protein